LLTSLVANTFGVRSQKVDQLIEKGLSLKVTHRLSLHMSCFRLHKPEGCRSYQYTSFTPGFLTDTVVAHCSWLLEGPVEAKPSREALKSQQKA